MAISALRHLRPVGKPAPPRPLRPEVSMALTTSSGDMLDSTLANAR